MLAGLAKNSPPVSIGDAVTQDKPRDSKIVQKGECQNASDRKRMWKQRNRTIVWDDRRRISNSFTLR
jgi:hypothetical protein